MLAMRTLDVIRATDYLAGRAELTGRPIVLVGEGLGGVWSLMACAFDRRPAAVVCVNTVPSYKLIVGSSICEVRDYYWLPGALSDFDLADLPGLIAPRPALLLDAVDATLKRLSPERCSEICAGSRGVYGGLGVSGRLRVVRTPDGTTRQLGEQVAETLAAVAEAGARPAGRPTDG